MKQDRRMKAIDEVKDSSMLPMHMNIECTKCKRCIAHNGKCYGKIGATPCMGYQAI